MCAHAMHIASLCAQQSHCEVDRSIGATQVILSILPIAFLVCTTLIGRVRLPASTSLPLSAFMLYFIRLVYFSHPPNFLNASIVQSLDALTPISIAAGAIGLFAVMDATLCTPYIIEKIKTLSNGHHTAEVFLIAWAFVFTLEGAAGFGTPPALSAPVLVAVGHPPLRTIVCVLMMDTLATPFGAVGTPIWFGLQDVLTSESALLEVSYKTGVLCFLCSLVIPVLSANFLVSFAELRRSALFIAVSILTTSGVMLGTSFVNYEFPALIGGLVGLLVTGLMAYYKIGLSDDQKDDGGVQRGRQDIDKKRKQAPKDEIISEEGYGNHKQDDEEGDEASPSLEERDKSEVAKMRRKQLRVRSSPQLVEMSKQGTIPGTNESASDLKGLGAGEEQVRPSFETHLSKLSKHASAIPPHMPPGFTIDGPDDPEDPHAPEPHNLLNGSKQHWAKVAIARTLPLSMTVLILIITRAVDAIGREVIQREEPSWTPQLGSLGEFKLTSGIIVGFNGIFLENGESEDPNRGAISWDYQTLYVPFVLPFVVSCAITVAWIRHDLQVPIRDIVKNIKQRVGGVVIPLFGSLALVNLLSNGGNAAPSTIIGERLAEAFQEAWIVLTPYIGALGSFFSGSTTVSNLTFAPVHESAATQLGWGTQGLTTLLALQNVGATMGNGITFANIVRLTIYMLVVFSIFLFLSLCVCVLCVAK